MTQARPSQLLLVFCLALDPALAGTADDPAADVSRAYGLRADHGRPRRARRSVLPVRVVVGRGDERAAAALAPGTGRAERDPAPARRTR